MANQSVRFDQDGADYTCELDPALGVTFTILGWIKLAVDRNNYSTFFGLDNGGTSSATALQTASDGTTMRVVSNAGSSSVVNSMNVGTWYCYALSRTALTGSSGVVVHYGTDPESLTTVNITPSGEWNDEPSFSVLRLGESAWGAEWLNGNLAGVKIYTRVLSANEASTELSYYMPVSTVNLYAAYPFWDGPSTVDAAGNGHTLSGGSGTEVESGPGIPFSPDEGGGGLEPGRFLLAYP